MGHCVESGYGLVDNDVVMLLDDEATPGVIAALGRSAQEKGIRLRVTREMRHGEMRTRSVEEV